MSLRDTITEKINYNYCRGAIKQPAKVTAEEILNLFEKRINLIPIDYHMEYLAIEGFKFALKQVKEILK